MSKTYTIRAPESPRFDECMTYCSEVLRQRTASKTFIDAIYMLPSYSKRVIDLEMERDELRSEIYRLNSIIESAREASLKLYESTAQADLLEDQLSF